MPQFVWDPQEFLELLGVVPEEAEYGASYRYHVERDGMSLDLTIWPMNPDVSIRVYCREQDEPLVNLQLLNCPAARVVHDRRGHYIEFAAAKAFTGRYDETSAAPYGFRLWVEPFFQVEPYAYPS